MKISIFSPCQKVLQLQQNVNHREKLEQGYENVNSRLVMEYIFSYDESLEHILQHFDVHTNYHKTNISTFFIDNCPFLSTDIHCSGDLDFRSNVFPWLGCWQEMDPSQDFPTSCHRLCLPIFQRQLSHLCSLWLMFQRTLSLKKKDMFIIIIYKHQTMKTIQWLL